ncbi:MAG: hypothetical protein ACODAE_05595 [Gemmatimonadota bacterium]
MTQNPVTIRFPGCTILFWNGGTYTETVFPDGTKCCALPEGTPEQAETAEELGYGDDVHAMCREHEALHTLLALARGLPHSPTLWDVAHGPPDPAPDHHYEEEADVLALQRLLNTGDPANDPDGRLTALAREIDLDALIERARTLLRERSFVEGPEPEDDSPTAGASSAA